MKKFDWGSSVGTLANVGVFAGLVMLAVELNQNNEVLEAQSRDVWVDRRAEILETMALNPELLELLLKAADASEPLSELEQQRVRSIGMRTLGVWEHQFHEMRRGRRSEREIVSLQQTVYNSDGNDFGTRFAWEQYKSRRAAPEYRIWFEENVVDTP